MGISGHESPRSHHAPYPGDDIENFRAEVEHEVEDLRTRGEAMNRRLMEKACDVGIKDFHGISFSLGKYEDIDARDAVFAGSDLRSVHFSFSDLGGASFKGANLTRTYFNAANLHGADFSEIVIGAEGKEKVTLDLTDAALHLEHDSMWEVEKVSEHLIGTCRDCEINNAHVMQRSVAAFRPRPWRDEAEPEIERNKLARRGVVIVQEGKPIGIMKLKGSESFLALRTVYNKEGVPVFWKGMVYALNEDISNLLKVRSRPKKDSFSWRKVDMEVLVRVAKKEDGEPMGFTRDAQRFIDDSNAYADMSKLVARMEDGTEPFEDLYPEETVDYQLSRDNAED